MTECDVRIRDQGKNGGRSDFEKDVRSLSERSLRHIVMGNYQAPLWMKQIAIQELLEREESGDVLASSCEK
jgi:hypothetical protein